MYFESRLQHSSGRELLQVGSQLLKHPNQIETVLSIILKVSKDSQDPNFYLLTLIGMAYLANNQILNSEKFFEKALHTAETDEQKSIAHANLVLSKISKPKKNTFYSRLEEFSEVESYSK